MWKVNGRQTTDDRQQTTDDGRRSPSDGKSWHCLWQGELKKSWIKIHKFITIFWDRLHFAHDVMLFIAIHLLYLVHHLITFTINIRPTTLLLRRCGIIVYVLDVQFPQILILCQWKWEYNWILWYINMTEWTSREK